VALLSHVSAQQAADFSILTRRPVTAAEALPTAPAYEVMKFLVPGGGSQFGSCSAGAGDRGLGDNRDIFDDSRFVMVVGRGGVGMRGVSIWET
jgi:hypothetical protein